MANKLDLLEIKITQFQDRIKRYAFISSIVLTIVLATITYFIDIYFKRYWYINWVSYSILIAVMIKTVESNLIESIIYKLHRKIKYNLQTAKAVWKLDPQKHMWIYIDISIEKRNLIINIMDEKSFTKGTVKKKVDAGDYNILDFELKELDKLNIMLRQESLCKNMFEEVDQLTEAERNQYIIDNMNIGDDVDK